ncbi:unnamed protein product [Rhizophagus irregularis]|nr:unnamed protein product [Rhizophagus irregularis]
MEIFETLPRKCFSCNICQKFIPSLTQPKKCAICDHMEEMHEQFANLRAQLLLQTYQERPTSAIETKSNNKEMNNDLAKDIEDFLQESSIRERLRNIPSAMQSQQRLTNHTGFKQTLKEVIMMPYIENNRIFSKGSKMWNELLSRGLIKLNVILYDGTVEGIEKKMIVEFPVIRDCGWQFLKPVGQNLTGLVPYEVQKPKNGLILREALTIRKRLYLGPTMKNLIEPSRSIEIPGLIESSGSIGNSRLNRSILNSYENLRLDERPAVADPISNVNFIIEENAAQKAFEPNNFRKDLLKSLRRKYFINEHDNINIRLDNLECTDKLLYWIFDASIEDILKNPIIVLNDDVIDTGGIFRNETELFWKNIKTNELIGGRLFDGDQLFLIQQNTSIISWEYPKMIGKLLFWCLLHAGSWPKWIDPLHFEYIFEGEDSIMCLNALFTHVPFLYNLAKDILEIPETRNSRKNDIELWAQYNGLDLNEMLLYNDNDLANYIAKFHVIDKRRNSLEMMKDGFDMANCLPELRKIGWKEFEKILYLKLDSEQFLKQLDKFQIEMTINEVPSVRLDRQQIFNWFKDWICNQSSETLEELLVFVSGTTRVPLEKKITIQWNSGHNKLLFASTCTCNLIICQNYNSSEEFCNFIELSIKYSDGFSETEYRRIGHQNQEVNNNHSVNTNVTDNIYNELNDTPRILTELTDSEEPTNISIDTSEQNNQDLVNRSETIDLSIVKKEFEIIDLTIDDPDSDSNVNENDAENDLAQETDSPNLNIKESDDKNDLALVRIDIRDELYAIEDRKKSNHKKSKLKNKSKNQPSHINEEDNTQKEHQFVEVTAEEILLNNGPKKQRKRKPKAINIRPPVKTRSKTTIEARSKVTTRSNNKDK